MASFGNNLNKQMLFNGANSDNDQDDNCGQCLMTIVARGTAIITEIYRLVELIPKPFINSHDNYGGTLRFVDKDKRWTLSDIVCDFSYFNRAETFEARIESEPTLKQADEEFCDTYVDILTRIYLTFESVQRHAQDLNRFVVDIEEEIYIGQSLDSLLVDTEARQLLCEAYFQLGYMLLLVDLSFEGHLREQLIVAYYRYSSYKSSPGTILDETCKLMRSTGFLNTARQKTSINIGGNNIGGLMSNHRPIGYPETYFARVGVNQSVVNTLIAKLQTVDIYNQTQRVFSHPDHRSNGLAQQASILYVLLYFCPNILMSQRSRMREITDMFFSDNWVVNLHMGELVNLLYAWQPYKAANESLNQIYDLDSVRSLASQFVVRFNRSSKQLHEYLVEGWLCEDTLIEHQVRIMNCIREANISLRWLLLHARMHPIQWCCTPTTGQNGNGPIGSQQVKILHAAVEANKPSSSDLCRFLQNLCTLEKKLAAIYDRVIEHRDTKMEANRQHACDMLDELVSIFNDSKPMRWVRAGANTGLAAIIGEARTALAALDLQSQNQNEFTGPGGVTISNAHKRDSIIKLLNRIESARESYSDGNSLQVVQLFRDTKESLLRLLRYLELSQDFKFVLQSVGDFNYSWHLMDELFTQDLQLIIKDNPLNLLGFEAIILKLTAAFEAQLVRIQQVNAQTDLISVSQYYSSRLVSYIRKVLQIIPTTIVELISCIIEIQTNQMRRNQHQQPSAPTIVPFMSSAKIALDNLRVYAQPGERARMLQVTCKISHYARGIMAMPSTAIGLVRINAKRMLEDGLRRELNEKMTCVIKETLHFGASANQRPGKRQNDRSRHLQDRSQKLVTKLEDLAMILGGYKRAFEYTQDYLAIYGLRMWQEELTSIVNDQVEKAITAIKDFQQMAELTHEAPPKSIMSFSTLVKGSATSRTHSQPVDQHDAPKRNFMTSLLEEMLEITCPRETIYDEQSSLWYDRKQEHQVLDGTKVCKLLASSLGVAGLNGLDRLCSTRLMMELEQLATNYKDDTSPEHWQVFEILNQISSNKLLYNDELSPSSVDSRRQQMVTLFFTLIGDANLQHQLSERLIDRLLLIGQLQTLRLCIGYVLSSKCRHEARHLYGCLSAVNNILLATLKHGVVKSAESTATSVAPNQQKQAIVNFGSSNSLTLAEDCLSSEANERPRTTLGSCIQLDESQLVFEIANYLEWVGLSDPLSKIYTMALHQRARLNQQQQQQFVDQSAASPSKATNPVKIMHRILERSAKIDQQLHFGQPKGLSASLGRFKAYELRGPGGGGASVTQVALDGQPLYLGLQTLLNHIGRTQVVVPAALGQI